MIEAEGTGALAEVVGAGRAIVGDGGAGCAEGAWLAGGGAGASALEAAGYQHLINILEGFEGALDADKHRGNIDGWRFHGLPWQQS